MGQQKQTQGRETAAWKPSSMVLLACLRTIKAQGTIVYVGLQCSLVLVAVSKPHSVMQPPAEHACLHIAQDGNQQCNWELHAVHNVRASDATVICAADVGVVATLTTCSWSSWSNII
jgi:hypothetical protein